MHNMRARISSEFFPGAGSREIFAARLDPALFIGQTRRRLVNFPARSAGAWFLSVLIGSVGFELVYVDGGTIL